MPIHYIYLIVAVFFETAGTALIKTSNEFTKLWPSVGVLICFATAFYLLSLTLRTFPVGIMYALWSGLGMVLITTIGVFFFKETLDAAAYIGLGLILTGVIVINMFSNSGTH